ncbi:MAG: hypothetical protein IJY06_02715 [Oscillospiraceae bacterium]|nr:hypothetical protein [Oscillospiraceae bacterium]
MELYVVPKGNEKYLISDKKDRKIYSVDKKRFSKQLILHDASGYALYSLLQLTTGMKPSFRIDFNEESFMKINCKSVYLDPSLECEGKGMKYLIKSQDRMNFEIYKNGTLVGKLLTEKQTNGEQKYYIEVDNKAFDDYIPLFAVCVDKCFSGLNK